MRSRPILDFLPLIALWVLLCGNRIQDTIPKTHTFGLSLNTGMNNEIFTLFVVQMHGMHVIGTEPISSEQFIKQAQGAVESKANPGREDLFRKFKIPSCTHPDSTQYTPYCPVLGDLWKLRFGEYPFLQPNGGIQEKGWAGNPGSPTPMQMVILADYGLMRLSGLIKDIDVFRLLHDIGDSTWVAAYQGGSAPSTQQE